MHSSQGSGQRLMIPLLDDLVGHKNRRDEKHDLTLAEAVEMVKEVFITAGEREIMVGDSVEIFCVTAAGVAAATFDLKKD